LSINSSLECVVPLLVAMDGLKLVISLQIRGYKTVLVSLRESAALTSVNVNQWRCSVTESWSSAGRPCLSLPC
jgi:hypothetical protein